MADEMTGGCACGKVRFEATVEPAEAYLCHCRMCQRSTGSVSIAFVNAMLDQVRWDGEPDWYDSSPIARRSYCRECGTSLGFMFKQDADKMFFKVPTLRNVSRTAPYFHDGSVATLPEAVKLMARHQLGKELPDADITSIVTWLKALDGEIPKDYVAEQKVPGAIPPAPKPGPVTSAAPATK